jgi:hypothetical protein
MIHRNNYRYAALIFIDCPDNMSSCSTMRNEPTPMAPKNFFGKQERPKNNLLSETPGNDPFERMKSE